MSAKVTGKRILSFLLLRPAINRRNMTTILLVLSLVLIAWLSGMRVELVPKVKRGAAFGTAQNAVSRDPRQPPKGMAAGNGVKRQPGVVNPTGQPGGYVQGSRPAKDDAFADIRRRLESGGSRRIDD